MNDLILKKKDLESRLDNLDSLAVAFSGGVDSTFLIAVAAKIFQSKGRNNQLIAITADSPVHPRQDLRATELFAQEQRIKHLIIHSDEMNSPEFRSNPPDRCYICKKIIFNDIIRVASEYGIKNIAHGVNIDDLGDYRPGLKAASEMNILSPLLEAGLTKYDIRQLSKQMGLSTWNKPASGCLATRIPYGKAIDQKKLNMVELSENFLSNLGFHSCRIRHYGEMAKIEVLPDELEKLMKASVRDQVVTALKKMGFLYVTIDLEGYQSGRLNRSVENK